MSNNINRSSLSRALECARALSNQTLVRPREAAAMLGISRKHLYALANRPDFPERVRISDRVVAASIRLERWIASKSTPQSAQSKGVAMNRGLNYADAAPRLLENGYEAISIIPGTKRPQLNKWTDINFLEPSEVSDCMAKYPKHGVGVKTSELVAIDLTPDYDLADNSNVCLLSWSRTYSLW